MKFVKLHFYNLKFILIFFFFKTLEEEINFNNAVKRLSTKHFIAPEYIIIGGVNANEGVIITRFL